MNECGTRFLLALAVWVFPLVGESYPIHRLLGPSEPEYVQEYVRRMGIWYSQEFGEIEAGLAPTEKAILKHCQATLTDFGKGLSDRFLHRSLWFSHTVKDSKTFHRKFFCAVDGGKPKGLQLLKQLFQQKKIKSPLPPQRVWGVMFDRDRDTMELQWLVTGEDLNQRRLESAMNTDSKLETSALEIMSDYKASGILEPLIYREIYKGNEMIDAGLMIPILDPPPSLTAKYPFGVAMIAWARNIFIHSESYDLLQLKSFSLYYLSDLGKYVAFKHQKEFNQLTLFMRWTSEKDYELFYP